MNETLTVTNRRTLSFPAIQPSDEISPPTLLNSLIDLAAEILGHRSKLFTTNNQNARQSIRQTGVLLVFLEELRDSAEELPYDVVLSFSELHVAFQKLRYLLEDCSRDGARFWMLVKSELIADQFRSLWRSISTAIDVLPMSRIEIDDELKEHVELAKYQARRSRYEVDSDDKRILQIVNAVLTGFENEVIPDKDIVRSILDYLKIQTWTKCHKEAKFLDSEMDLENQSKEKSEMSRLSSLMGFVCYCRCTLFDSVDEDGVESDHQLAGNLHGGDLPVGITEDDLRCPITLETMTDPVTIASGQTFDRASIAKWFAAGNLTCPNTGEKLPTTATVPNSAIRSLITRPGFSGSGHRTTRRVKREPLNPSPAARNAARATAKLLVQSLETGCARQKNKASYEVRALSKTSPFNRACLVGAGAVPPLLTLLGSSNPSSSSSIQENSSAALLNLSKLSETREAVFRSSGLKTIASVLRDKLGSSSETKQHIAGVVFYLASAENLRPLVGEYPEIIPGLVGLIRDGTDRGKRNAMIAIFGLLASQENRPRVVSAGTVSTLVSFLNPPESESESELVTDSLAILSILVEESELIPSCLDPVIRILNCPNSSRTSKELCVSLLLGLCKNGENKETVSVLAKSGSVMSSLYSILSRGTNRGTKKASALINVLHEFHDRRSSSGLMVPMIRQERIVRAW